MHWRQIRSGTGSRKQWYEQQKDVWEGCLDEFKTLIILPTLLYLVVKISYFPGSRKIPYAVANEGNLFRTEGRTLRYLR